jgi:hypothetical protein
MPNGSAHKSCLHWRPRQVGSLTASRGFAYACPRPQRGLRGIGSEAAIAGPRSPVASIRRVLRSGSSEAVRRAMRGHGTGTSGSRRVLRPRWRRACGEDPCCLILGRTRLRWARPPQLRLTRTPVPDRNNRRGSGVRQKVQARSIPDRTVGWDHRRHRGCRGPNALAEGPALTQVDRRTACGGVAPAALGRGVRAFTRSRSERIRQSR